MVPRMQAPQGNELVDLVGEDDEDSILYDTPDSSVTAYSGTLMDYDNPQHYKGSFSPRYAIAIQWYRDQGDYTTADKARDFVNKSTTTRVECGKDYTRVYNT